MGCRGDLTPGDRLPPPLAEAARLAIDALHSDALLSEFARFEKTHAKDPDLAPNWRGLDAASTLAEVRANIQGLEVASTGSPRAWLAAIFAGNMAYDGGREGPVLLNRYRLERSPASFANTFAHEASHRAGLSHPSSKSDMARAICEPPYVIGSLVEKHATGAGWRPGPGDCPHIESMPARDLGI